MLNISSSTTTVTTSTFLICTLVSLILGVAIAATFCYKKKNSKSFLLTLGLLPVIVQVVIMLVNGNLGTGVAVMGAFSLVRFRSIPGTAKDICAIFLSMAAGLATGTDHLALAIIFTAIVCVIAVVYSLLPFGESDKAEKELTVIIPESLDYSDVFDDIFLKYTDKNELVSVKTTNMGSMFKLKYEVILKNKNDEKKMIDEIRCRNGNLEIMCGRKTDAIVEQL